MQRILIVGLGNPGNGYKYNRHNTGLMCIDFLAETFNFPLFKKKDLGEITNLVIKNTDVLLVKPNVFMNTSGKSVSYFKNKYSPDKIIIIHDDLESKLGRMKLRFGGSDRGHNGLASIRQVLGNNYWKIKIGIDRPELKEDVTNYVLSNFSKTEMNIIQSVFSQIALQFEDILFSNEKL